LSVKSLWISRDNIIPSADLKNKYLDFSKQHGWKESSNSVFRVNTAEGYEALNPSLSIFCLSVSPGASQSCLSI
jgi:hypothetical protein